MKKKLAAVAIIMAVLLVAIVLFVFVTPIIPAQNINGLNGEAGIIRSDGTVIPFGMMPSLSIWTVNNVAIGENDWFYAKFWLALTAHGLSSQTTAVRFRLTQTWQGAVEPAQQFGTTTNGKAVTSPTDSWLIAQLPKDTVVTVPLKYRDATFISGATFAEPTTPAPMCTYDSANNQMIREARLIKCGYLNTPTDGTYTLVLSASVDGIDFTYGSITPSPATVSFTFVITKTTGTLTASLTGSTG